MNRSLGYIMFMAGLGMLLVSFMFPMVTVLLDSTPPKWSVASDGKEAIFPRIGKTYSEVKFVTVAVEDRESGVVSVEATVDVANYVCTLKLGTKYEGVWYSPTFPALSPGLHSIKVVATNDVGLSTTFHGTFAVYTGLQGKWYVNNVEVTDPAQVVKATSLTVNFKFVKTAGVEDSKIKCTVVEGTTTLTTLTNTTTGTWTGSYTFTAGSHTLALKAYDGTTTVTMSVLNMQLGPTPPEVPRLNMLQILGLASTGIGLLLIFTGRRKSGG